MREEKKKAEASFPPKCARSQQRPGRGQSRGRCGGGGRGPPVRSCGGNKQLFWSSSDEDVAQRPEMGGSQTADCDRKTDRQTFLLSVF